MNIEQQSFESGNKILTKEQFLKNGKALFLFDKLRNFVLRHPGLFIWEGN